MNAERCGNCRFLEPVATVCRRYPPTIAVIDGKEVSFHLVVFADIGWCGEWRLDYGRPTMKQDGVYDTHAVRLDDGSWSDGVPRDENGKVALA